MSLSAHASMFVLALVSVGLLSGCAPDASETGNPTASKENRAVSESSGTKSAGEKATESTKDSEKDADNKESLKNQPAKNLTAKSSEPTNPNEPAAPTPPEVINDPAFHEALAAAADQYLTFAMVNATALAAPADCRPAADETQPLISQSGDEATHGKKMYFLFAKEIAHYLNQDGKPAPVGQVLVKESWTSKPSNPGARNMRTHASGLRISPRTKVGKEILEIGKRKELFVMLKLDSKTPGTDEGWVYGIVNPETKQVTESGKVNSCIKCHQDADHDRLFGPAILSL